MVYGDLFDYDEIIFKELAKLEKVKSIQLKSYKSWENIKYNEYIKELLKKENLEQINFQVFEIKAKINERDFELDQQTIENSLIINGGKYFDSFSLINLSPSSLSSFLYIYFPFPRPVICSFLYKLIEFGKASSFIFV